MTIKQLPAANFARPFAQVTSAPSARALASWDSGLRAATADDERTISILDVIGQDYWTGEGVTAKRIAGALRNMGAGPVTVNVNSPGGDMFEGLAIYNLLREHKGEVAINVIGIAASAASVIAMGADSLRVARAGFLMTHNSWVIAAGNRNDFREIADWLEPFDESMADIYAARSGSDRAAMLKMMDAESWIGGAAAVEKGFADGLLESDEIKSEPAKARAAAIRRLEASLRAQGMSKTEAMRLLSEAKIGMGDPAGSGAGDSRDDKSADVLAVLKSFKVE